MKLKSKIVSIAIDDVGWDKGTQSRLVIDDDDVKEYAAEMGAGATFPPILAFDDGTQTYWLADGFHRLAAAEQAGHKTIKCEVRKGGLRDAILYAVGANATHGLPRSNADKRNAVKMLLDDDEWVKWSDSEIARRCAVHQTFVGKVRKELTQDNLKSPTTRNGQSPTRKGADGRTIDTTNIGKSKKPRAKQEPPVRAEEPPSDDQDLGTLKLQAGEEIKIVPVETIATGWTELSADQRRQFIFDMPEGMFLELSEFVKERSNQVPEPLEMRSRGIL